MIRTRQLSVPEQTLQHWQKMVDLIADIADIPASLIMRVHEHEIEVFTSSRSPGNPYHDNEMAELGTGLYCETVINTKQPLLVENALTNPSWDANPDIKLGMISYYGLPINWPNGKPFGTICMLDSKENHYGERPKELLARFQEALEADLKLLYQQNELIETNQLLEQRVKERTRDLEQLNNELAGEIDRRNAVESLLERNQYVDLLTGLPNRASLTERLDHMLNQATESERQVAVVCFGLQNFKSINNSYGHLVGDEVLKQFGRRLRDIAELDQYIARGAGDEFLMAITADDAAETVRDLMHRLAAVFTQPFVIDETHISVVLNAGITIAPEDGRGPFALLQKASAAMSVAKEQNHPFSFFSEEIQSEMQERYQLESHLFDALANDEMHLHYQPVICTQTRKLLGAEALLRWHNPELGNVPPDRFIGVAERTGQIIEIGNFVLRTAIAQAARWQKLLKREFRIAVNISPVQFSDQQLVENIHHLLDVYQLAPENLELEVTEGVLLQDTFQAETVIGAIRDLGIRISLDDFGTGYSSLSYLQKYAFDTLKIDRSFIMNLEHRNQDKELTRAIIAIARKLNLQVIAEGVESEQQHQFIKAEGCDCGQGYWYGRPIAEEQFTSQYIEAGRTQKLQ